MQQPIIGITLDHEQSGDYNSLPYYALRENYFSAVAELGAVPLALPHHPKYAQTYLEHIDGLIVSGGAFDVSPALYGAATMHETVTTKNKRTDFEIAMIKGALKQNMPLLGICGGEQLLNVLLGGTLIQHIPDTIPTALEHEQSATRTKPSHSVAIKEGTLLHKITNVLEMQVNSSHHQAVETVGKGVVISATAPDGVIEAIEYTEHPFCLGVEWHPEYLISNADANIIKALIKKAG